MSLYAVIMAGGSGTRFWPISRATRPKQLLKITGDKTLLAMTVDRVRPIVPPEAIIILTRRTLHRATREALPDIPPENIIAEPVQRNTAACVGLAAHLIGHGDPEAILIALPADHIIRDEPTFREILSAAVEMAREGGEIVTFSIPPSGPETSFGYIESGEPVASKGEYEFRRVLSFHEKPDEDKAREFLAAGFAWNSGIFVFPAETILDEIQGHLPELASGLKKIDPGAPPEKLADHIARVYPDLPAVSIDHGVMEKSDRILTVKADMGWSDVGGFGALPEIFGQEEGNCVVGEGLALSGEGNILFSGPGEIVVTIGVSDLIVVHTPDATLVCRKDQAQDIREAVKKLRESGREKYL